MSNLTNDERAVLEKLKDAWELFLRLPVQNPMHTTEFAGFIHNAQRMIMSRPVSRDENWVMHDTKGAEMPMNREHPKAFQVDYSRIPEGYSSSREIIKALREHVVADWEKDDMRAKGYNVIWGDDAFIPLFPNATDLSPGFKEESAAWSYMYPNYFMGFLTPISKDEALRKFE